MIYIQTLLAFFLLILQGCTNKPLVGQNLIIISESTQDVVLFKIPKPHEPDPDTFIPVTHFQTNVEQKFEPGSYFLTTECSSYAFELKLSDPKKIIMSKVVLDRYQTKDNKVNQDEPLLLECSDPLDGRINRWTDKTEFFVFPGETSFSLAKKPYSVKSPTDKSEIHTIQLSPVLVSAGVDTSMLRNKFFILPFENTPVADSFVISAEAGKKVWLPPGTFTIELNGTKRNITVESNMQHEILVGQLRIEMPEAFSSEERLKVGGQPVFAYINGGVLLNLNTNYLVIPGEYTVSMEGSEIQKTVLVEPHKKTVITTKVAQINQPPCQANIAPCKAVGKITVHKEQRPYALMYVDVGVPFLVFDEVYEYGVDGSRGILKILPTGTNTLNTETIARVKIKWEVKHASGKARTDLVKLEAHGSSTFGRSLDLLFSKPDEIYVPAGQYALSYFVGDPSLERVKTKIDLLLEPGSTKTVVVPIYTDRLLKNKEQADSESKSNAETPTNQLPTTLNPIRK